MRFGWLRGKVQVISACCTFLQKRMQHYAYKQGSIRDNCRMISEIRITPQKERIQWTAVRYPREAQHPPRGQRDRSREPTPASSRLLLLLSLLHPSGGRILPASPPGITVYFCCFAPTANSPASLHLLIFYSQLKFYYTPDDAQFRVLHLLVFQFEPLRDTHFPLLHRTGT